MIRDALQSQIAAFERIGHPALMERFILRNGRVMETIEFRDALYPAKACFMNATHYVDLHKFATYVEGYAIRPGLGILVHHAWAETRNGRAIDPTWNDSLNCEYIGVTIDRDAHRKIMRKTGVYGVLDQGHGINTDFIFAADPALKGIVEKIMKREVV